MMVSLIQKMIHQDVAAAALGSSVEANNHLGEMFPGALQAYF